MKRKTDNKNDSAKKDSKPVLALTVETLRTITGGSTIKFPPWYTRA
jgi:hypothetical protein